MIYLDLHLGSWPHSPDAPRHWSNGPIVPYIYKKWRKISKLRIQFIQYFKEISDSLQQFSCSFQLQNGVMLCRSHGYTDFYSFRFWNTGCFTILGHNYRRWFPRSLWSKSSYKHVSDFGRVRSYDRLKLRIEGNDYWQ